MNEFLQLAGLIFVGLIGGLVAITVAVLLFCGKTPDNK